MPETTEIPAAPEPREIILDRPETKADIIAPSGETADATKVADGEQTPEAKAEAAKAEEAHKSRSQRRREREIAERVRLETENKLLREQAAANAKPAAAAEDKEPQRDDFPDVVDYLKALAKHEGKMEARAQAKAERETREAEAKKAAPNAEHAELAKKWTEREKAFQAEAPDYQEAVQEFVSDPDGLKTFSDGARRLIVESDVGPQVLHQLATDHDLADRIAALSPVRQIAELGKLEAKFTPAEPAKKTSSAPNPPTPPKSTKAQAKDLSKMSIQELNKAAREAGSRWAN